MENFSRDELASLLNAYSEQVKTPLHAMAGWLEVVRLSNERGLDIPDRAIDGIRQAVKQQAEIIEQMGRVIRPLPRRLLSDGQPTTDLCQVLHHVLQMTRPADRPAISGLPPSGPVECPDNGEVRAFCEELTRFLRWLGGTTVARVVTEAGEQPSLELLVEGGAQSAAALDVITGEESLDELAADSRLLLQVWRLSSRLWRARMRMDPAGRYAVRIHMM